MGLNRDVKFLLEAVADSNMEKAKSISRAIVTNETSNTNLQFCKRIKAKLDTAPLKMLELPYNVKEFLVMKDASSFNDRRYYQTDREVTLYKQIEDYYKLNGKLAELGIRNLNTTLLYGESGTGKTTFGQYVAYMLDLPFVYVNFSQLIDSYLGKTGKNIDTAFRFVEDKACVFMLDEIDAIGCERRNDHGTQGEMLRVVISLMQSLDRLNNNVVVLAATNMLNMLDKALMRRFKVKHEVLMLTPNEAAEMFCMYTKDLELPLDQESISQYFNACVDLFANKENCIKQSDVINLITNAVINHLKTGKPVCLER